MYLLMMESLFGHNARKLFRRYVGVPHDNHHTEFKLKWLTNEAAKSVDIKACYDNRAFYLDNEPCVTEAPLKEITD